MRTFKLLILLCWVFLETRAQEQTIHQLDIDNGLPTNFVYNMLVDRQGYLWIASQKGVVRYNGYETKLFNFSNGLHKEDIWRMYEDKRGRIWLSSISRQIGYIYNGSFRPVYNKDDKLLYPVDIREYEDGIYFISRVSNTFYIEKDDTLYPGPNVGALASWVVKDNDEIIVNHNDSLFNVRLNFGDGKLLSWKKEYIMPAQSNFSSYSETYIIANHTVAYRKGSPILWISDLQQKTYGAIDIRKMTGTECTIQRFYMFNDSYHGPRQYMIVTEKDVYVLDTTLTLHKVKELSQLISGGMESNNLSFYAEHSLWNKAVSGYTNGVYILSKPENMFVNVFKTDLKDYKYLGKDALGQNYWWKNKDKLLARLDTGNRATIEKHEELTRISYITPYNKNTSIISGWESVSMIDNRSMKTTNYLSQFKKLTTNNSRSVSNTRLFLDAQNIAIAGKHIYSRGLGGTSELTPKGDSLDAYFFTLERYDDMTYDSLRKLLWLYSSDHIDIYKGRKQQYTIANKHLKALHIKAIERILVDNTYGNIFIKDYDKLLIFDYEKQTLRPLFENFMLNNANVTIYNNTLTAAGKFGILFCKIKGKGKIGQPIVYPNPKSINYNYVVDMQVSDQNVLLKTDKQTYILKVPAGNLLENAGTFQQQEFKMIMVYNDRYIDIKKNDTAKILQDNPVIHVDVINAEGNGMPVYEYNIAGISNGWSRMEGNDLSLPKLTAGNYYTLQIVVHDATWRSNPVELHIYIVPYWWQKPGWQIAFWIGGFVIILGFGIVVARVTRKIVEESNKRRNARLELELKAIYSQINPHFIYNTLNSALLLINNRKMEEAYTHVSKFSRLLRAYVKSSRNKYITLEEEVSNIRNYIELQQTRFKNKFDYSINIDTGVDTGYERIPSLLLQPFIENAINHGLLNKSEKGELKISFRKTGVNDIICTIEDDGIGRIEAKAVNSNRDSKHESFGNAMIKDLVDIFNRYEKIKIEIQFIDKVSPLTGTIVEIHIKRGTS